jgi:isoleucyl-tRNA synthetase
MTENKQQNYPKTTPSPEFPKLEENVLKNWQADKVFEKSVDNLPSEAEGGKEFSFFDGPPFANGLPHYGHLLTSCVKDIYARYHTMKGERTERVFGWDCHGLPAEMESEKQLNIHGQLAIQEYGIGKFNDHCRTSVMKYTQEWKDYVNRIGRWVDFDNGYKTMDRNYMESVIWAFKQLHEKGLVYEGHKVMPYSWAAETPLSNFETRLDNSYREKTSKALTVAFELVDRIQSSEFGVQEGKKVYVLAWTTTPWTLPSNCALAVGKDVAYTFVETDNAIYILGKNAASKLSSELGIDTENTELRTLNSELLIGLRYKPMFPYFAEDKRVGEKGFTILEGDFVSDEDGTGIVHLAPGFGEDDQRVCEANGICTPDTGGIICPVDHKGCFTDEIFDIEDAELPLSLKGLNVVKAKEKSEAEPYNEKQLEKYGLVNLRIVKYLIAKGNTRSEWQEDYVHSYPHCWRTDQPLIYKAVPSWYVKVTAFKDRMVELNQKINWIPNHIRDGQFGKWLENAHDWAISRNRFWGAPIPVWKTESGKMKVFGSIEELQEFFGVEVNDLHRPFIDELTKVDPETGETYHRVDEVLDCWFESGSMPFAELHYPFENQDKFKCRFPADFIVEYTAQTRGWFYTLMVLSTALFDEIPFKNCICHGVILGEPVKTLIPVRWKSKSFPKGLKNYPDPVEVFNTLGADAMRWMMIASPVMNGGELTIAKDGADIRDIVRLTLKPIWNAYHFFCLYANSDGVKAEERFDSENLMDRYILSKLKIVVEKIQERLDSYDTQTACKQVEDFFEVLNNWYIRRSRERFWRSTEYTEDQDKKDAYDTLYTCLVTISKAAAPLLPYLAEEVYTGLTGGESVHLQKFPDVSSLQLDNDLADSMDRVRDICNAGLAVRNRENIRIRQPLASATCYFEEADQLQGYENIVADELNVKNVVLSNELDKVANRNLKINFPVLGKRLPEKMKDIIATSKQGKWSQNSEGLIEILGEVLNEEEASLTLQATEAKGAEAVSDNSGLVVLDLEISEELKQEGYARDVVRLIQQARKEADLHISDKINLALEADGELATSIENFSDYIAEQTLAASVRTEGSELSKFSESYEIEGHKIQISFEVAREAVA